MGDQERDPWAHGVVSTTNKSVERIAAGGQCSQFPSRLSAAIAHFFRWAQAFDWRALPLVPLRIGITSEP